LGLEVNLQHSGIEGQRFSPEVETVAYRVVQEALTNVARHAQVRRCEVRLSVAQETLAIHIEDKGVGFSVERQVAQPAQTGGLPGIRERTELVGGVFQICSSPGNGTSVYVELPTSRTATPGG
jgi:signal transduction histidine kinase